MKNMNDLPLGIKQLFTSITHLKEGKKFWSSRMMIKERLVNLFINMPNNF